MNTYLALVPQPAENICAEELSLLSGITNIQVFPGVVSFEGSIEILYKVNLWSRCATRILLVIADFPCQTAEELYEKTTQIPWNEWMKLENTFSIHMGGKLPSAIHHLFGSLRIKDAIVDQFRSRFGQRPNIDTDNPTFQIHAQFYQKEDLTRCALCLDSSGKSLSYRSYRTQTSIAPIRENLAAIILYLAKYHQKPYATPVLDPFCGSGTFLIEAAQIAHRHAPGLQRTFSFQNWPSFNKELWKKLRADAIAVQIKGREQFLFGFDQSPKAIQQSSHHIKQSGFSESIILEQKKIEKVIPPINITGILVCNPPYGKRLGDEDLLIPTYRALGDTLKQHFSGWNAYIFTGSLPLSRQIGLRPKKRYILFNGPVEARLLEFDLYPKRFISP